MLTGLSVYEGVCESKLMQKKQLETNLYRLTAVLSTSCNFKPTEIKVSERLFKV